jgi:hypothetical protein
MKGEAKGVYMPPKLYSEHFQEFPFNTPLGSYDTLNSVKKGVFQHAREEIFEEHQIQEFLRD